MVSSVDLRQGPQAGSQNATATVATFAAETKYEDLPDDIRDLSRALLIDSLGCAIGGHLVSKGTIPRDLIRSMGGAEQASIIGDSISAPIPFACFVNGELINALDFDAILAPGHVSPYVIPPALAFAEVKKASGKQLIVANALAHEVGCRVAAALDGIRQWDGDKVLRLSPASGYGSTVFGAAAGAGSILGFDRVAMANLFGIVGYAAPVPSLTKFLNAKHSFHVKYTSAGQIAMSAALSAQLAEAGFHGDETVLDGDCGFWKMFASQTCNWDFMLGALGREWRMTRNEFKPYPAFRMSHDAVFALRQIIAENKLAPADITKIVATADPITLSQCYLTTELTDHTDAQLSWRLILASAAYYQPGPDWQTTALEDPRVRELSRRVDVIRAPDSEGALKALTSDKSFNKSFPAWLKSSVEIHVKDRVYKKAAPTATKGHHSNPMTVEEIEEKFVGNSSRVLGLAEAKAALAALKNLDSSDAVAVIQTLKRSAKG